MPTSIGSHRPWKARPPCRRLIHVKTEHLGPDELLVAAKLEFAPELSIDQLAEAINGVETALRDAVPIARVVYIEPDVYRPAVSSS